MIDPMILGDKSNIQLALLDSGANIHIATLELVKELQLHSTYFKTPININTAGKNNIIHAIGKVDLGGYIRKMLIVPKADKNLLSVSILQENGLDITFTRTNFCILRDLGKTALEIPRHVNRLYYVFVNAFIESKLN